MNLESISLLQLSGNIKSALQNQIPTAVWVVAEISEMNLNRTGHCYLELIEKEPFGDKIAAKCRATIWSFAFRMIKPYFETTTGETLRAGLKILVKASIEFHEIYGLSLNINDIDPQYTMGDIALKKAQVIKQLETDGVLDMNLQLPISLVPQRIAVISSETAAGYGDFTDQLKNNAFGFDFHTQLFPALMQGDQAPQSIIQAFEHIFNCIDEFDAVALIRGGGSKSDLSCFDDYSLAYYITQFPLPIITGIGHERDDSVVDLVAHTRLKTPTAVAGFLIERATVFASQLNENLLYLKDLLKQKNNANEQLLQNYSFRLKSAIHEQLSFEQQLLNRVTSNLFFGLKQEFQNNDRSIEKLQTRGISSVKNHFIHYHEELKWKHKELTTSLQHYILKQEQKITLFEGKILWVNPQQILERGFALVSQNGKVLTNTNQVILDIPLKIQLSKGFITSNIEKID